MHTPDPLARADGASSAPLVRQPHRLGLERYSTHWPTVTAVIPTLNEAENLRWLLPRLTAADEVVIVDGESTDGTVEITRLLRPDAVIIIEPPIGKGSAMRTGMAAATSEVLIMLDADGSMDPAEFDAFLALIGRGFDIVKGTRYGCGGASDDLTRIRSRGNRWLTRLANLLYRTRWTDLCYGYVAMRRSAVERLQLTSTGFEIETELCVNAVRSGLRMAEVASHERDRRYGESNLRTLRDGWRVLKTMLRLRFRGRLGDTPATQPLEPVAVNWQSTALGRVESR
ncbi:glycosyltransferase family 2 protein [Actinomadura sp. HBU206391]|uniref:glycosyltransferase family 2 protein n=1 Tax=Actinomadura sp. HBU206391 TaxID=2731692 RepID=UPI00164F0715|nr:glycosyltransferase family 2 protein [Actinomadura sp. HBU206391]MBC6459323.1 glycosyltransferase family 2 protein [Actinomadura sp. HBU206391]